MDYNSVQTGTYAAQMGCQFQKAESTMKCLACHEQMETRIGEIELRLNDQLFLVENVSYQICLSCGERVLDPEVSQKIFNKVTSRQYTDKHMVLPVIQGQSPSPCQGVSW